MPKGGLIEGLTAAGELRGLLELPEVPEPGELDQGGAALQGVGPHRAPVLVAQHPAPLVASPPGTVLHLKVVQLGGGGGRRDI